MTEFTPEWIAKARNACIFFGEPATTEFRKALDHIERQAKRIEELEQDKTFFQELVNRWSNRYYKVTKELRQRIAELESVNEDQALTISQNDYAYAVDKEMMEAEIKESNGLLRSAFMIAKRDGKETNWEAFRNQVSIALERQHKMMYPKGEK